MKQILLLTIITLALVAPALADQYYQLTLNYDGDYTLEDVYVLGGSYKTPVMDDNGHYAKIIGLNNQNLYITSFTPQPQTTLKLPYFSNAKELQITNNAGTNLITIPVSYYSDTCGNNICEEHESSYDCPQDCPKSGEDGYCEMDLDNICDPDCGRGDPDCGYLNFTPYVIGLLVIIILVFSINIYRKQNRTQRQLQKLRGSIKANK